MTINIATNTTYNTFLKQAGITAKTNNDAAKQNTPSSESPNAAVNVGEIVQKASNKKQIFGIIGVSAGSMLLLSIIGIAVLTKGFSGSIATKFKEISESARKKIFELTTQTKNLTKPQKLQLKLNKSIQHIADTMQASSNVTAIKDSFVYHWIKKLKMGKLVDKINNFFKKITLKTKNQSYQNAEYSAIEFCNYLKSIALKNPKSQDSKFLNEKADAIIKLYMESFSSPQHIKRSQEAWDNLANLHSEVYDKLFKQSLHKNLKTLRSYITTDLISERRMQVLEANISKKNQISNALSDVNTNIKNSLFKLKVDIKPSNENAVNIIQEISQLLNKNKILQNHTETAKRHEIFEQITKSLDELSSIIQNDYKTIDELKTAKKKIEHLKHLLSKESYQKGYVQEAMSCIKRLAGDKNSDTYKQAKKLADKLNKNLNSAISQENTVYEKLAELRVGSAATDVFGILTPTAIGTFLVVDAKDKDERITKTLTQGIPILGGVGTTYYGTTRGFTGVKNLALGLGTSYLLNILGAETDKLVKKYMKEQEKLRKAFESFTKMQKNSTKQEKIIAQKV